MDHITGPDGESLYVDPAAGKRGQKGPFFIAYTDQHAEERWGFFCSNCETADSAVDSMGRVQCNVCSNRTKAEEWDAAHE